jgi:hypothetical protein
MNNLIYSKDELTKSLKVSQKVWSHFSASSLALPLLSLVKKLSGKSGRLCQLLLLLDAECSFFENCLERKSWQLTERHQVFLYQQKISNQPCPAQPCPAQLSEPN